jgi:pimeloyl-ACP methyl ester carboxylesterase
LHGVSHNGGVFEGLAADLAERGHFVVGVDLRGHGESLREPPWNAATHVGDVLDTVDALGIQRATWVGHSFGGRLAAMLAVEAPELTKGAALLDPGLEVPPGRALQGAEIERLDWSFATVDGALSAMLSSTSMVAPDRAAVASWVRSDVSVGPDGRHRFSFCPSAAVVAWSEVVLPPPPVARVPTLLLAAEVSLTDPSVQARRFRDELGNLLTTVVVPNGHNVFWESAAETTAAVEAFLEHV